MGKVGRDKGRGMEIGVLTGRELEERVVEWRRGCDIKESER